MTEYTFDHIEEAMRECTKRLVDSLAGDYGFDQARVAVAGLELLVTVLKKNSDYGSSVFKTPVLTPGLSPGDGILVRLSDKIERLQRLLGGKSAEVDESIEETMQDLAGYAILYLARPEGNHEDNR